MTSPRSMGSARPRAGWVRRCSGCGPVARSSSSAPARILGSSPRSPAVALAGPRSWSAARPCPSCRRQSCRRRAGAAGRPAGPRFRHAPERLFSHDGYHPSAAGYALVADQLLGLAPCARRGRWHDDIRSFVTVGRGRTWSRPAATQAHGAVVAAAHNRGAGTRHRAERQLATTFGLARRRTAGLRPVVKPAIPVRLGAVSRRQRTGGIPPAGRGTSGRSG